ncbi:lipoprotein-attachment site-containing protein [Andreprevotia lacus DSM 23236]|jgi:predicted small lipoprotein YifL|uniref:Lipoprotein-attachment site-containing protein n=1 Tax=Andreprevotia lacus DSM 23236 TaxID=1121001 RepID=A0A1W1WZQ7_9NEIS|nr:lipoprotein [Andreprevotia lacus]SMC17020.1 lipoprotein-attachment site-containing protein [Andreprevotia lacus DSM 23236]
MRVCALLLLVIASLTACGFKGPLYLPKPGETAPAKARPAASQASAVGVFG